MNTTTNYVINYLPTPILKIMLLAPRTAIFMSLAIPIWLDVENEV